MIEFKCTCGGVLRARDDQGGRKCKCPACGAIMTIPGHPPETAAPAHVRADLDSQAAAEEASASGQPPESPSPAETRRKRPLGLVWIVFYWLLLGVTLITAGSILSSMGYVVGTSAKSVGLDDLLAASGGKRSSTVGGAMALLEFLGILMFHLGLLHAVACYGLWAYRRWGFVCARVLAIADVVLDLILLILALSSGMSVVTLLVVLLTACVILAYVWGYSPAGVFQRHLRRLRTLGPTTWEGYD